MNEAVQANLHDQFGRMYERLTAAAKNFTDADRSYVESGEALEFAVCEVLANYYDPANRRALLIPVEREARAEAGSDGLIRQRHLVFFDASGQTDSPGTTSRPLAMKCLL